MIEVSTAQITGIHAFGPVESTATAAKRHALTSGAPARGPGAPARRAAPAQRAGPQPRRAEPRMIGERPWLR